MTTYTVKRVHDGKVATLHRFNNRDAAFEYAVAYSNENNISTLIYGKNPNRAMCFTHKMSNSNYQVMR